MSSSNSWDNVSELLRNPQEYLARNWREEVEVIAGAPATLLLITILAVVITWWIFRFFHKRQLDQIPILERQLAAKDEHHKHTIRYKDAEIHQLERQLTATKITTSDELTEVFRASFVREHITPSHIEGNAIVLQHTPIPDTVHLIIITVTLVAPIQKGISVKGRKVFLENIPDDIQFLDAVLIEVPKGHVVVEYHRDFSAKELEDIKKNQ